MANLPAIVLDLSIGQQRQITTSDTLYVGAGIDRQTAGALSVGGTTANALSLGASGITTTVAGPLSQTTGQVTLAGNVDATAGLDVTVAALTAAAGFTNSGGEALISGGNLQLNDSINLTLGTGDDLTLVHNGTNTVITSATGDLIIDNTAATGSTLLDLGTDTSATDVQIRNNTGTALMTVDGSGQATFSGNVDASNGLDVTTAALTAAAGLTVTGGAVTMGTSVTNIDLDPTGDFTLDMDAGGTFDVAMSDSAATFSVADNVADAFAVKQGSDVYIDVTTTNSAEAVNIGNATTNPAFAFVGTGQLDVGGDVVVAGNFTVQGDSFVSEAETVLYDDNHLYLNNGYETVSAETGGLVINYLPTGTNDTVAATGFVAGVPATSNPTVKTAGSATFAAGDLIQITGANSAENKGLFEVLSHVTTTLTIRGIGTSATTQDWVQNQFVTDTVVAGTIRKVNCSVIRAGTDGLWEVGLGATTTGFTFDDLATAAGATLGSAYQAGRAITGDSGPITYAFSTVAGGVLDVNVAGGAAVLADTAAVIDVTYAANAYTGGASVLRGDWSGMTSLTLAGDASMVNLIGKTNAGAGGSIGISIASFDESIIADAAIRLQADSKPFSVGAGDDFSISHDGTNTTVTSATGDLIIDNTLATGSTINRLGTDTSATDFQVQNNSASPLLTVDGAGQATFAGNVDATNGLDVTTAVLSTAAGFTNSGGEALISGGNLQLNDSINLTVGTGDDLTIVHNGTNTVITSVTGDLIIDNTLVTGSTLLDLGTDTSATDVQIRNNTGTALMTVNGAGQATFSGNVDATNGLDVTTAALTAAAALTVTGGAFTHSGGAINLDPTGAFTLDMDSGQAVTVTMNDTAFTVAGGDNLANAIVLEDTNGDDYVAITTTTGSESITLGNAANNPEFNWLGTGEWNFAGSPGTAGYALVSNGASAAPTWQAVAESGQLVTGNWDTDTNSVAVNDVAAYTTTADRADQADATAASGAQTCIGISQVLHASTGEIVRGGRYPTARFAASLTLANGGRCFVSKTAGALTDDVSGYTTGDKVIPVGWIRDTLTYNGTDDFLVDIELDFGEITTIA